MNGSAADCAALRRSSSRRSSGVISAPSTSSGMPRRNRIVSACTSRGAANAHVRRARRHCQPGVVVDEHPAPVERDFLPAVPRAQHAPNARHRARSPRPASCRFRMALPVSSCRANAATQIAATISWVLRRIIRTPLPVASNTRRKRCRHHPRTAFASRSVALAIDRHYADAFPCIQAIYDDLIAACDERFQRSQSVRRARHTIAQHMTPCDASRKTRHSITLRCTQRDGPLQPRCARASFTGDIA